MELAIYTMFELAIDKSLDVAILITSLNKHFNSFRIRKVIIELSSPMYDYLCYYKQNNCSQLEIYRNNMEKFNQKNVARMLLCGHIFQHALFDYSCDALKTIQNNIGQEIFAGNFNEGLEMMHELQEILNMYADLVIENRMCCTKPFVSIQSLIKLINALKDDEEYFDSFRPILPSQDLMQIIVLTNNKNIIIGCINELVNMQNFNINTLYEFIRANAIPNEKKNFIHGVIKDLLI